MAEHHFNVFGVRIAVVSTDTGWSSFLLGSDGKRRPADIVVPSFIKEAELGHYLADLLHELATPDNNQVVKLK
ncbi:MAG: DUF7661 family protein [Burkholderiaceae bacterium]